MSLDYTPLGNAIAQLEKSLVYANSSAAMADPGLREQLPEQGQHALWRLVGLGNHGRTGLLQDLRTAQVGCFGCEVGVYDPATSC